MDGKLVWKKQDESVLDTLERTGRYVAKKEYITQDLGDQAHLVLTACNWLVKSCPIAPEKPEDAENPIWVSPAREATMMPGPGAVILELEIEQAHRLCQHQQVGHHLGGEAGMGEAGDAVTLKNRHLFPGSGKRRIRRKTTVSHH